jgi:hypothetical protein
MNARSRRNGQRIRGRFFPMPHEVIRSRAFNSLSGAAIRMLLLMATKYRGDNNGMLVCTSDFMAGFGWKSNGSRQRYLAELEVSGLLCRTRHGGKNRAAYYALAWLDCDVPPERHGMFAGSFQRCFLDPLSMRLLTTPHTSADGNSRSDPSVGVNESTKTPLTDLSVEVKRLKAWPQRRGQFDLGVEVKESPARTSFSSEERSRHVQVAATAPTMGREDDKT